MADQAAPEPDACVPAEGSHDTRARIVARVQAMGAWAKRTDTTTITGKESLTRQAQPLPVMGDGRTAMAPQTEAMSLRLVVEGTTVADRNTRLVIQDSFVPASQGLPARFCARVVP